MSEEKKVKISKPKLTLTYDLLEGAVKTWWKNLGKFTSVLLWGLLFTIIPVVVGAVLLVVDRVIIGKLDSMAGLQVSFLILSIILLFACFLAFIYFAIRAYMGAFLLVKKNYTGDELKIFKETKKYFWSYFWLSILTTVFVLLWALLLIIPGIIFSIFYSFAVYAFFFEGLTGMEAIRRSVNLVKNYWWAVFGRFIVIGIALYIFIMITSIPLYFVDENSSFALIWGAIVQIISFLIGPISLLYFYQIYQDLVKIKK